VLLPNTLGSTEWTFPIAIFETTYVAHLVAAGSERRMLAHDLETNRARHIVGLVVVEIDKSVTLDLNEDTFDIYLNDSFQSHPVGSGPSQTRQRREQEARSFSTLSKGLSRTF
jgi:hypothetical protein